MTPLILIPAAGASSRMGEQDKLLEQVDGLPLIARQARVALATGLPVSVTVPAGNLARATALSQVTHPNLSVQVIETPENGLSESIKQGARAAAHHDGMIVMLADLPELEPDDLLLFADEIAKTPHCTARATDETGGKGHPVFVPHHRLPDAESLSGDAGLAELLEREELRQILLKAAKATTDLDTPEDWQEWRANYIGGRY